MRLICPECGAQYEVAADAIPASGRDVQCSNCSHMWFQRPDGAPDEAANARYEGSGEAWDRRMDDASDPSSPKVPVVEDDDEEADDLAAAEADRDEPGPEREPQADSISPPRGTRSSVSPEVAEILREEAALEARARAAEARVSNVGVARPPRLGAAGVAAPDAEPAESMPTDDAAGDASNPDLPLQERQRSEEARRRMARLRGDNAATTNAAVSPSPASRRSRLPDIEDVTSSLRSVHESGGAATPASQAATRSGFRLGLGSVLLVAAILALVYVNASRITVAMPGSAAVLGPYAAIIDEGRIWLDMRLRDVLRLVAGEDAEPATTETPLNEALPSAIPSVDEAPAVLDEGPALIAPAE